MNLPRIALVFNIRDHFAVYFVVGMVLIGAGILFRFWPIQTLGKLLASHQLSKNSLN